MRVCIHQPDFVPYLGFFHRLLLVDIFVLFDDVQFLRRGWNHRDKIKTRQGASWLTLSIKKGDVHQKINEARLGDSAEGWIWENLDLIHENYCRAPCFDEFFPKIQEIYMKGFDRLMDINMAFLKLFFEVFEIDVKLVLSSTLATEGQNNQKLINTLKKVSGSVYLSGIGAKSYLDESLFRKEGLIVEWQQFAHPTYQQLHGSFIPNLSCLDLLLNCGRESKDVLRSCLIKK